MSNYNWCHGPSCHENKTQDRIRGVKGSKVLRTRKIPENNWNRDYWTKYFCSQGCMLHYIQTHINKVIAIAPRLEALETPITDPKKTTHTYNYGYGNHNYTTTEFEKIEG
tara:strand:+ start:214 stop:543 length:330 start_codon:yes stop_codon:yes gene_type:complete